MKFDRFRQISLRYFVFPLALFTAIGFARTLRAQTHTNQAVTSANRWLLIVETSRAMQSRAGAAQQIAASLTDSGMNGQMRRNDTLGVWTFNESLYTGRFPLQDWTPESRTDIARLVFTFLKSQKNEKVTRFGSVATNLQQVAKASNLLTVIILSEGSAPIQGTPFDAKINASYKEWQAQQKASQMPFLTVLRAKGGQFTDFAVSTPPFPLELPPLPPEPPPKIKPAEIVAEPPPKPVVPSLIISGRKPEIISTQTLPEPQVIAEPIKPEATSSPEKVLTPMVESNAVATAVPQDNPAANGGETNGPVQVAFSVPAETVSNHKVRWMAALAGIGLVGVVIFFVVRRSRNSAGASLITRSLDHDPR
jgi:hypothetical protein